MFFWNGLNQQLRHTNVSHDFLKSIFVIITVLFYCILFYILEYNRI